MSYRWMPIMGEFETSSNSIVFKGGTHVQQPNQVTGQAETIVRAGMLLSNIKMVNGRLSAKVRFNQVSDRTVCELFVAHDLKTKGQITAGLGGDFGMFSIREWKPSATQQGGWSWVDHEVLGDRRNLKAGVDYEISVRVLGSNIYLNVDGVEVATATLPMATNQPRQIGIFCLGEDDIHISDFSASVERPKAFIVMQFSSPYNEVYSHVIKDACDEFQIDAIRADEIYGPGIIIKDVIDRITQSQVIIADISPSNPNVYFEVGYALALGKPIILLAQRRTPDAPLPFDLSAFRVLFYDDSIGGKPKLESGLREHLREILGRPN